MNFFIFSALVNAFISGLLVFFVVFKNRKDLISRLFFYLNLSIVLWSLSYWQWMSSDNFVSALFWSRILSIGSLFIPIFYFHWILTFLDLNKKNKNLIRFIYLVVFVIFIFSFSSLFIKEVEPKSIFNFWPVPGILYTFYLISIYFGLTLYTLFILWRHYKISESTKKLSIKYIIISSLIGFGGGATNFFLWYDIPILPYGNILVFIYPLILGFAIFKYQLFNIKAILTEFLVFAIWVAILFKLLLEETLKGRLLVGGLFVFTIVAGILLIRSVLREVEQKEQMEKLANELESMNQKLKETDRLRTEMYSFVSHQIKAPIGIVKGFAQLLYDGSYGKIPKKAKEITVYIKTACDRLINLTETFLNLRRIEEGKMDYQFKDLNIVDLAKSIVDELKILAEQKKLELSFNLEALDIQKIVIKADEVRLRQVIQNLIENAIKYTQKGFVKVNLRLTTDDQQQGVLFSVSDSGMGIKPEVLPELFDQFKRAKEARLIQGTGLGLYIAREIVKAHKGEIWAESEGEGRGSTFYVRLGISGRN